jgi:hypothetical protein
VRPNVQKVAVHGPPAGELKSSTSQMDVCGATHTKIDTFFCKEAKIKPFQAANADGRILAQGSFVNLFSQVGPYVCGCLWSEGVTSEYPYFSRASVDVSQL